MCVYCWAGVDLLLLLLLLVVVVVCLVCVHGYTMAYHWSVVYT